jgi:hypothetical protein
MMRIDSVHRVWLLALSCPLFACGGGGQGDGDETSTTGDGDTDSGDGDGDTDSGDGDGDGDGEPGSLRGASCSPASSSCAAAELCCSTDPAALDFADLGALVLPAYPGKGTGDGIPLFADSNNNLSQRGVCVPEGDVPDYADLEGAPGCPIPCNPNWSAPDVNEICGQNTICCQIEELQPEDCVLDSSLGDAGCWRPATGEDIVGLGGQELSDWGVDAHATHQDPGLTSGCESLVNGLPPEIEPDDFRAACQRRLRVANERGLCLGVGPGVQACPFADPAYIDACEQLNLDRGLGGC